jgi:SSS family transporter
MKRMMKKLIAASLIIVGLPGLSGAELPAEGFFKFSVGAPPASALVSVIDARPEAARVFQGLENVILAGGNEAPVVQYTLTDGQLIAEPLPELPGVMARPGAAVAGRKLFVAGGSALLKLNLDDPESGWISCSPLPVEASGRPVLVNLNGTLYVTGLGPSGAELCVYNPTRDEWVSRSAAPENLSGAAGVACGDAHLLFFSTSRADDRILAYNKITDNWLEMGRLPQAVLPLGAVPSGTEFTLLTQSASMTGTALLTPTKYGIWDHLVVGLLATALIGLGIFFSKREKSSSDYFRAGKRIPWWAAGLSLFANGASAISLMAMPGKAFSENWIYFSGVFYILLTQLPLVLLVYVPLARRLKIATANEYLEKRYNLSIRLLGSLIFSLNQMLGRMASILLLPAIAISSIFGLPMEYSILIMGCVATIYVTLGGLEAVVWTDVLQAVVMLGAVVICLIWALCSLDIVPVEAMVSLREMGKLQLFDTSFDWTAPIVLILFSNTISVAMGMIGDQNFIQRVQCTHDEKEARKAVITQLAVAIPMNAVLFALGTLLFLFYKQHPAGLSPALKADGIFPFFAAQNLPVGMAGLVVAALLAATMSTVSGAVNSVANIGMEDVYRRFFKKATDHSCLIVGKVLAFCLGVFGTVSALLLARTSLLSVWDLALMITGMILAPITGFFVLGIFSRRANAFGVGIGALASVVANFYAKFYLNMHSMAYLAVGVFTCIIVGWLASLLAPRPAGGKVDGLTIYTLQKTEEE